jgi:hypothetical protein
VLAGLIGAGLWLARRLKGEQVPDTQATRT